MKSRISSKKLAAASLVVASIVAGGTAVSAASPFGSQPVTLQAQKGKVCTEQAHGFPGGGTQGNTYACSGLRFSPDGKKVFAEFRVEDNQFVNGDGVTVSRARTQVLSAQFIVDGKPVEAAIGTPTTATGVTVFEAGLTIPAGAKKVQVAQNYQAVVNNLRPGGADLVVSSGTVTSDKVNVPKVK